MALSEIEHIAEQNGMHIIICQSNKREKSLVKELIQAGVDGLIT